MVARIKFSTSIRKPFHYNDLKVKADQATCLMAENLMVESCLQRPEIAALIMEKLTKLRADVKINTLHISLNFSPDEQLSDDKMREISRDYMEGIGFGDQPYLVFRHHDSGHPHCHIVTTNIKFDKTRISVHEIGKKKSEPIRKYLEEKYQLIKAEGRNIGWTKLQPVEASKVIYGKSATARAIGNVLGEVISKYKFTSLAELNAILGLYNIMADRGAPGSRTYQSGGLNYRIINAYGQKVGVPIKASLFANSPTLKTLEGKFLKNDVARAPFRAALKSKIDVTLKFKKPSSLEELKNQLKDRGIRLIPRINDTGVIYGLTYIDLKTKSIFNGNDLGKDYSAKRILEKIHLAQDSDPKSALKSTLTYPVSKDDSIGKIAKIVSEDYHALDEKSAMELLMQYEYAATNVPYEWKKRRKKKKKR